MRVTRTRIINDNPKCVGCPYNTPKVQGDHGRECNGGTMDEQDRCPEWRINEMRATKPVKLPPGPPDWIDKGYPKRDPKTKSLHQLRKEKAQLERRLDRITSNAPRAAEVMSEIERLDVEINRRLGR